MERRWGGRVRRERPPFSFEAGQLCVSSDRGYRSRDGGLGDGVDAAAERTAYSGVVRVDRSGATDSPIALAASRTRSTRVLASVAKGFTALAVMSLVEDGTLQL